MTTETICLKLDDSFLAEIGGLVASSNFQNRTEFIRAALREKVENIKMQVSLEVLRKMKGSSKTHTTDEDLEIAREKVFDEMMKRFK